MNTVPKQKLRDWDQKYRVRLFLKFSPALNTFIIYGVSKSCPGHFVMCLDIPCDERQKVFVIIGTFS